MLGVHPQCTVKITKQEARNKMALNLELTWSNVFFVSL